MANDLDERSRFYIRLGAALNAWQTVEFQAYLIFEVMMKRTPRQLKSVVFFHIQSFDSAITLMDRCAYYVVPDDMKETWKSLRKRLRDHSDIRNRMVHGRLLRTVVGGRNQFFIGPSPANEIHTVRGRASDSKYQMTATRLRRAEVDFQKLRGDLSEFERALRDMAR